LGPFQTGRADTILKYETTASGNAAGASEVLMTRFSFPKLMAIFAVAVTLGMLVSTADARIGGGFSMGSRGARTFSAPPSTSTAPSTAAPIQRSITQPTRPNVGGPAAATPGFGRGLFGGGLLGGLAAGFLGAGLFGLLFGHGLFGGLGGFASLLGLILQIGLVVLIARLLWSMWARRQPAFASGPSLRDAPGSGGQGGMGGFGGGAGGFTGGKVDVTSADFDTFERLLGETQTAYSNEDLAALRARVTPEMLSYFSEQLSENASRGVVNKVSDVKLLQGDLAEAWRDGSVEYASVAMRFALVDRTIDRASGRLVDGSESPQEVTEVWTFMRSGHGNWLLSAIQQT
jgi:predicted lipid-binding transport protein (Tim44 family)